jgi:hypothetical protein
MNEELQSRITDILTALQNATSKAADFAGEQLPDTAQSYIMYGRVSATVWLALSIAALWVIWRRVAPKVEKDADAGAGLLIGCALSIAPSVVFIEGLQRAMMAWCAPKVWLLLQIKDMIK